MGWVAWTVFCVGLGALFGEAVEDKTPWHRVAAGFGLGCLLWAVGAFVVMAIWSFA